MPKALSPHSGRWFRISYETPLYAVSPDDPQTIIPWPIRPNGSFKPDPAQSTPTPPAGLESATEIWQTMVNNAIGQSGQAPTIKASKKTGNKLYNLPLIEAFAYKLQNKKQPGEIGLEIECEGTNLFNTPMRWWGCHADGSLRAHGDHPPVEYVLRKPESRADVKKALDYLTVKLRESGSQIDDSIRTSVHVHLNCQQLTIKQIAQIWCLYTILEEALVEFSGPTRVGNLFCLRAKDAEHSVQIWESALQNENYNDLFSDHLRYTSCNTASLGKFGSLEFRSMRGTVDQPLIELWIDTLIMIRDKALKYNDPTEIVVDFEKLGPAAFLNKVCYPRNDILGIFSGMPDLNQSLWDGMRLMRDVAYAVKWEKFDPTLKAKETKKVRYSFLPPDATEMGGLDNSEGCRVFYSSQMNRYWLINETTNQRAIQITPQWITKVPARVGRRYSTNSVYDGQTYQLDDYI